ncbi:MAG TPA: hypothetical protein VHW72_18105 [Candidatus Angelobacter sp.]|jgi:hypothetical protein|nr:hypothetical protein [Candidatus Angelobacter sp.]
MAGLVPALSQSPATDIQPPLPQDATQYVRETIKHQMEADAADHTHWRYHIHKEDDRGSQDRDVIDTKDGQIARTLLINGKPLTAEQRSADEMRMKKLVEDPGERAKRDKRAKEDEEKGVQMFKAIPDAFIFKYEGAENGLVRLSFFPNPHYNAPTRELQVFRSMSGMIWIDRAALRMSRLDGSLFEDVTFGWGLLGRLNKGGTFSVTQRQVGDDHWEIVSLDVKMSGHAVIFKSINVRQVQRITAFHRISDNMTISEAYQLLEQGEGPVSAGNQSGSATPLGKN